MFRKQYLTQPTPNPDPGFTPPNRSEGRNNTVKGRPGSRWRRATRQPVEMTGLVTIAPTTGSRETGTYSGNSYT